VEEVEGCVLLLGSGSVVEERDMRALRDPISIPTGISTSFGGEEDDAIVLVLG